MTKDDVSTYKHAAFVHEHICKQIHKFVSTNCWKFNLNIKTIFTIFR